MNGEPYDLFLRPHLVPEPVPRSYLAAAALADRFGYRSLLYGDHLGMGEATSKYPYGEFAHHPETPWPEPTLLLSAVAAVTSKLRLSTGVLLAPLRSTLHFAKTAATLDWLSDGRVELGLGVGWQREEYEAAGVPWDERYARLRQALVDSRRIWTGELVELEAASGGTVALRSLPRPVQRRLPILLGINTRPSNLALLAEHADGWCPAGIGPTQLRASLETVSGARAEAGTAEAPFMVRVSLVPRWLPDGSVDTAALAEETAEWRDAGATHVALAPLRPFADMADLSRFLEQAAEVTQAADVAGAIE